MRKCLLGTAALSAASLLLSSGTFAQTTAPGNGNTEVSALETVVVTAQHRSEDEQKAAVALNVVQGEDLVDNNINEPSGLGFLVPALAPTPNGFFMRGVGNFEPNVLADPAIAFNYDGDYIARPLSTSGFFYDLERVEVLKGPQGTLYGRNATGGAINVIPQPPQTDSTSAFIDGDYGTHGTYGVQGAVNLALDDQTALRASGDVFGHDAYNSDGTDDELTRAARFQILHDFSSALTVKLGADYEYIGGVGPGSTYSDRYTAPTACAAASCAYAGNVYGVTPSGLGTSLGLFAPASQAYRETMISGPAKRPLNPLVDQPFQNNNDYGVNAEIDYRTSIGDFTVLPEWRHSSLDSLTAVTGFPVIVVSPDEQESVEARYQSKSISIFDFTAGGMYFHENNVALYSVNQSAIAAFINADQKTDSYAGFSQVTAHVADALRLVGGVRYTEDDKAFVDDSTTLSIACTGPYTATGGCAGSAKHPEVPLFSTFETLAEQQAATNLPTSMLGPSLTGVTAPICVPVGPHCVVTPPAVAGTYTGAVEERIDLPQNVTLDKGHATFRGAVEYDVAPDSLAYASVETGFHSGGFNAAAGYPTFKPEYITAYTVGGKNRFFDNTVQLNLEGFIWDYRNQQISHQGIDQNGNQANITQNIGSSTNQGVEAQGLWEITSSTLFRSDIQYLDATYNSFVYTASAPGNVAPATGCSQVLTKVTLPAIASTVINCSHREALNSPKWTANFGFQQTFDIGGFGIVAEADTQYKARRYIGFEYLAAERQAATWQANAALTLVPNSGGWTVQVFGTNLGNERYKVNDVYFASASTLVSSYSAPQIIGGRLTYKY